MFIASLENNPQPIYRRIRNVLLLSELGFDSTQTFLNTSPTGVLMRFNWVVKKET
jgi:hypothetical protein